MKVLHINCNYIGTTLHQTMIEHLDAFGVDSRVFVPTYNKNIAVIDVNDNVTVAECFNNRDRIIFDYKSNKIRETVKDNYNINEFDLLHAYTLFTDGNVAYKLHKEFGIPYVVAIRNTDVNNFLKYMVHLRPRAVKIMENASEVFFLSEAYRKEVFQKYVPSAKRSLIYDKAHIVPNGIDDYWFRNLYIDRKPYRNERPLEIIYAGGIDRNKNIETTQSALSILRSRGMKINFTVVGKIKDRQIFEKIAADPYTQYVAAQPKEKLITYYRRADIFVMPSHTETFGLVYAEAMSQGLPVVYTKGQGFDGQFPEGIVGYSVNDNDPESVARAISLIVDKYEYHSEECKNNIEKFRWDNICADYLGYYKMAVNNESA